MSVETAISGPAVGPDMVYSPQQIKWDLLSAIREYGTDASGWTVCLSDGPPEATLGTLGLDADGMAYMGKPALTERAARLVHDFLTRRMGVASAPAPQRGNWIMVYRPKTDGAA